MIRASGEVPSRGSCINLCESPIHCKANVSVQSLSVGSVRLVQVRVKQDALDAAKDAERAADDALKAKGADVGAVNAEVEQIQEEIAGAEQSIRVCSKFCWQSCWLMGAA